VVTWNYQLAHVLHVISPVLHAIRRHQLANVRQWQQLSENKVLIISHVRAYLDILIRKHLPKYARNASPSIVFISRKRGGEGGR